MKKVLHILLMAALFVNIGFSISTSLASYDAAERVSSPLQDNEYVLSGGATPLGIIACTGGYTICMQYAESWWERLICDAAWITCITLT